MSEWKCRRTDRFWKQVVLLIILCILLFCKGVAYAENQEDQETLSRKESAVTERQNSGAEEEKLSREAGYGAWMTYWDAESALFEEAQFGDRLEELVCFEVFFKENGDWLIPDETRMMLDALREHNTMVYVSLVNDVQMADGTVVQKSSDLLEQLLSSRTARSAHIAQIMELIDQLGISGIELDYENMKSETRLWELYAEFLEELFPILEHNGVRLRAVMECQAPRYAEFPAGPEYICMCYNLYGYHSGPGPKADRAFLEKLGESWKSVPGEVRMAFATGGFLWAGNTVVKAMTEEEAAEYLEQEGITAKRDAGSGALTARYRADQEYSVWYADGETLSVWRDILQAMGYQHFDLFRLGGNRCTSLSEFLKK